MCKNRFGIVPMLEASDRFWTVFGTAEQVYRQETQLMMTSSNGNIFRVTGPLCGEFTGPGEFPPQRPVTRSFDVLFDLRLNKRLSKQSWGWWFETPSWSLWRQCNVSNSPDPGSCIYRSRRWSRDIRGTADIVGSVPNALRALKMVGRWGRGEDGARDTGGRAECGIRAEGFRKVGEAGRPMGKHWGPVLVWTHQGQPGSSNPGRARLWRLWLAGRGLELVTIPGADDSTGWESVTGFFMIRESTRKERDIVTGGAHSGMGNMSSPGGYTRLKCSRQESRAMHG